MKGWTAGELEELLESRKERKHFILSEGIPG